MKKATIKAPREPAADERPGLFGDTDPAIAWNRVWFNLQRVQRSMAPRIARALREEGIPDPIWYEILLEVEKAGPEGIRMATVERRLFLPQYALSRHVTRMEKARLIRREPDARDGRGHVLFLTPNGVGVHDRVWVAHQLAIRSELAHRVTTEEAYELTRLLIKLYP
jgi:DNA-binding MarR family transcriptional regulator